MRLLTHEIPYYEQLYKQVNPEGLATIPSHNFVKLFKQAGLSRAILKAIWNLADRSGMGSLDTDGFYAACRLVAHAQAGKTPEPGLSYSDPANLPNFDYDSVDLDSPVLAARSPPAVASSPAAARTNSPPKQMLPQKVNVQLGPDLATDVARRMEAKGSDPILAGLRVNSPNRQRSRSPKILDRITEKDQRKYALLYARNSAKPHAGIGISVARDIFSRSGLSEFQISAILNSLLADRAGGVAESLSRGEFVVSMHLVTMAKKGNPIPSVLPSELKHYVSVLSDDASSNFISDEVPRFGSSRDVADLSGPDTGTAPSSASPLKSSSQEPPREDSPERGKSTSPDPLAILKSSEPLIEKKDGVNVLSGHMIEAVTERDKAHLTYFREECDRLQYDIDSLTSSTAECNSSREQLEGMVSFLCLTISIDDFIELVNINCAFRS